MAEKVASLGLTPATVASWYAAMARSAHSVHSGSSFFLSESSSSASHCARLMFLRSSGSVRARILDKVTPMRMLSATSDGGWPALRLRLYVSQVSDASPCRAHELSSSHHVCSSGSKPAARISASASNILSMSPPRPLAITSMVK